MENKLNAQKNSNGRTSLKMKNEKKEKEKPQINMSFGEKNNNKQNSGSKEEEKEISTVNKFHKQPSKTVTFSSIEKKPEEENNNKNANNNTNNNVAQNSSFEIEPRFGSFKKIKEILHMSKCGIQTPGQEKPNQDNYCITKNIFNDKNLENYFFAVW